MSQIPFVNQLGDAIEAAISTDAVRSPAVPGRRALWRWRLPRASTFRRHQRAGIVLAALVIGGGAVAVAETFQNSTALVAGGIVCYAGTGTGASQMYADVEADGRSPEAACADVFRADGPAALGGPGVRLRACADRNGYVAVFASSGAADQCKAEGMSPLQARSYHAAEANVDHLVQALTKLGASRQCIAPSMLVGDVQRVLERSGWSNWHAELQKQPAGSGGCGLFLGTGSSVSDPTASLDAGQHVVWVVAGPLPTLLTLTGPLDLRLLKASGRHCYTPAGARALVRRSLPTGRIQVRFALTQEPAGGGWAYAQGNYARGCTIIASIAAAPYGSVVDAWLNSMSGPPEASGGGPATSQFQHAASSGNGRVP